ncbi:uncharacterized protein RCC_07122 [Ramularia collo-cygni]|uniref:Uncharacterized protein n=1 Tax=Ramularia collo-cygni TaxID=112498 RepID=A0A2D3VH55_9PEZI|nr:uncharacterized protein RCC_07122 [Ramularia collo-cygni]CZT21259.1 uncharacterized protein RCC_07122 [Ramularia collo-cygni]
MANLSTSSSTTTDDRLRADSNPTGQVFGHAHSQAWELFRAQKLDQAIQLAQRMLSEPRLGNFHRAGFHLIMAFGDDQYVEHAERALALYQELAPTPRVELLKKRAQDILNDAREDFAAESAQEIDGERVEEGGEMKEEGGIEEETFQEGEDIDPEMTIDMFKIVSQEQAVYDDEQKEIRKDVALAGLGDEDEDEVITGAEEDGDEAWDPSIHLAGVDVGPGSDVDEDNFDSDGSEDFVVSDEDEDEDEGDVNDAKRIDLEGKEKGEHLSSSSA